MSTPELSDASTSSKRMTVSTTGTQSGLFIAALITLILLHVGIESSRMLFQWSVTKKDIPRSSVLVDLSTTSIMTNATTTECIPANQHLAGVVATPSAPTDLIGEMWCVLDENNTALFKHFPHASQALLPCWSWFQRIRERGGGSNMSCGFYLKPDLKISRWCAALVNLMGCSVTYDPPPFISTKNHDKTMILHYDNKVGRGLQWFERPEDAAALRSLLLERYANSTAAGSQPRSISEQSAITIINRRGSRRLVNIENITTALREAYPSAFIQSVFMEEMQPMEQFVFWSQQSIVITPHGAGLMNGIFLPPGNASAVIEIFPPHYYLVRFFSNLLRSCGIRIYGYYNNVVDPVADFKVYGSTKEQRRMYRSVDLEPPVDDIVGLVRQALMGRDRIVYPTS